LALALLPAGLLAAPAPPPPDDSKVVKRIVLPSGPVKWERGKTKVGVVVRVSAGKVTAQGKRLFYGDGKVALEVEATEKGMRFLHTWGTEGPIESSGGPDPDIFGPGIIFGGTCTHMPGLTWFLKPGAPTADRLKPGSVYIITPSIKFKRKHPEVRPPR
jgi:hypothetical protein